MKKSFPNSLLLLPVLITPLILFTPVLISGKAIFWGTPLLQFVPWWDLAWSQLREGYLPLWNPYVGMGAPLMANYQVAIFYPPHWIYLIFHWIGGRPFMAWGISLMIAAHLGWAGAGMALLVRRLRLGLLAQAIAGLAFGMGGYLVARAGFLSINAAVAWMPWVLLCFTPLHWGEKLTSRQQVWVILCLTLQLLAGHAQTTWHTWILSGIWVAFLGWHGAYDRKGTNTDSQDGRSWIKFRLRRLGYAIKLLSAGFIPALGLAAVQLFPTAEYLNFSHRAEAVDYELAMTYSFWPWRLLSLFAPDLFGNPAQGDYWGYANYWEDAIYIGLLPLLLGIGGLLGAFRRKANHDRTFETFFDLRDFALSRVFRRFILFLIAMGLLLGLGRNTPIFPWLYEHLPGFDLFQAPTRYMIWTEFAVCLAAALGAETWHRPEKRGLYWTRLATAGALAVSLGAGLTWYLLGDVRPTFIRATALAGMWGVAAGLLSLIAPKSIERSQSESDRRTEWWRWGTVFLVAVDLLVASQGLNPAIDLGVYRRSHTVESIGLRLGNQRLFISPGNEQELKYERFLRFDSFDSGKKWQVFRSVILPNTNVLERLSSANNFDPLVPGIYARWMDSLEMSATAVTYDLYRLMNVGLIETIDLSQPNGVRFDPVPGGKRLRWIGCIVPARDPIEALFKVTGGEVDFDKQVVLEGQPVKSGDCSFFHQVKRLEIIEEIPTRLAVEVDAPESGFLVLSDVWYPGWQAWVDGRQVPIERGNFLFRAVAVNKGPQQVIFQYRPLSFYAGVWVSICTVIAIIIFRRKLGSEMIDQQLNPF